MPQLIDISSFLDSYFQIDQYPIEKHGIWKPAAAPVRQMGFVLEPWPQIYEWIMQHHLDALFIHRPWKLDLARVPTGTGILSYHLPFDEKLTLGYNTLLAEQLNMTEIEPIGEKEGRPLGMTGLISSTTFQSFTAVIETLFGYPEQIQIGKMGHINKIAVVGAMTESLVLEAVRKGVHLYLTGQLRKPAASAVAQTGLHVIATGHYQSERFGLHVFAKLLAGKWQDLEVHLAPI